MAVKEFNCNKLKKTVWPFTLKDRTDENGNVTEKGKRIVVRMPQKKVFEAIQEIQNLDADNPTMEDTMAIYRTLYAVLNNNLGHIKITMEEIEEYDIEDVMAIFDAYMDFVNELKTDPN